MPYYTCQGNVARHKHTCFYQNNSERLYKEELASSGGFSRVYSTKYHIHAPTRVTQVATGGAITVPEWPEALLNYYHFFTEEKPLSGDFLSARQAFLFNADCRISTVQISHNTAFFYRNAYEHELWFVHRGTGVCHSEYGRLPLAAGDYLVIPKSTTIQVHFDDPQNTKLLLLESTTPFEIPAHFRNDRGQILEHAPYCERDFQVPTLEPAKDEKGGFDLKVKAGRKLLNYTLDHHPFDVVGWDGYLYPFTFNINHYNPVVGKIHLPPPVHLVFTTQSFVVCNFVPRLYDFHPRAIPAPYFHSNCDSDEVLYYVEGQFMSRKGIQPGSMTLHPMGIPHGPQPGKIEESVGKKQTDELAVMVDTFAPLKLTTHVRECMVADYYQSWMET